MATGKQKGVSFKKLIQSFKNAFSGLKVAIAEEQTFKIQIGIGVLAVGLGFYLKLPFEAMAILVLTVMVVLSLELLNSQIERILDFLKEDFDPKIKRIKDLCASAVLLVCLGSLAIGFFNFSSLFVKITFHS